MDQQTVNTLITTSINAGVSRIDTASLYGGSEIRIGEYLRKNEVYISIFQLKYEFQRL